MTGGFFRRGGDLYNVLALSFGLVDPHALQGALVVGELELIFHKTGQAAVFGGDAAGKFRAPGHMAVKGKPAPVDIFRIDAGGIAIRRAFRIGHLEGDNAPHLFNVQGTVGAQPLLNIVLGGIHAGNTPLVGKLQNTDGLGPLLNGACAGLGGHPVGDLIFVSHRGAAVFQNFRNVFRHGNFIAGQRQAGGEVLQTVVAFVDGKGQGDGLHAGAVGDGQGVVSPDRFVHGHAVFIFNSIRVCIDPAVFSALDHLLHGKGIIHLGAVAVLGDLQIAEAIRIGNMVLVVQGGTDHQTGSEHFPVDHVAAGTGHQHVFGSFRPGAVQLRVAHPEGGLAGKAVVGNIVPLQIHIPGLGIVFIQADRKGLIRHGETLGIIHGPVVQLAGGPAGPNVVLAVRRVAGHVELGRRYRGGNPVRFILVGNLRRQHIHNHAHGACHIILVPGGVVGIYRAVDLPDLLAVHPVVALRRGSASVPGVCNGRFLYTVVGKRLAGRSGSGRSLDQLGGGIRLGQLAAGGAVLRGLQQRAVLQHEFPLHFFRKLFYAHFPFGSRDGVGGNGGGHVILQVHRLGVAVSDGHPPLRRIVELGLLPVGDLITGIFAPLELGHRKVGIGDGDHLVRIGRIGDHVGAEGVVHQSHKPFHHIFLIHVLVPQIRGAAHLGRHGSGSVPLSPAGGADPPIGDLGHTIIIVSNAFLVDVGRAAAELAVLVLLDHAGGSHGHGNPLAVFFVVELIHDLLGGSIVLRQPDRVREQGVPGRFGGLGASAVVIAGVALELQVHNGHVAVHVFPFAFLPVAPAVGELHIIVQQAGAGVGNAGLIRPVVSPGGGHQQAAEVRVQAAPVGVGAHTLDKAVID